MWPLRPALLSHLKSAGVQRLGDRQKLTNALAKAERAGLLSPYLDEGRALASGLHAGKLVPFPHAEKASSHLANATELKKLGNEAFKAAQHAPAIDLYAAAAMAANQAATDAVSKEAAAELLSSLHANVLLVHVE